jgi:hypothetical protein
MSTTQTDKQIVGYECRFAVYCPPTGNEDSTDYHLVKEIIHYSDKTTKPNVRLIRDFKRPFWITRKGFQNHQQKKEWEELEKVVRFECTQTNLARSISRALNQYGFKGSLRQLFRNPYIYGADILSTAVLKRSYQDKFPTLLTEYTEAAFDVETDTIRGTDEIIMATLSYGSRVITCIQKSFVEGYADVENQLRTRLIKYLGPYVEKRKINWEVKFVDREVDIVIECFKKAHEWEPDFVAIWNIDFDLTKMLKALERAGIEPKNVFCDPSVPEKYKFFKYEQGNKQKVTASGKVTPIKPAMQWHVVYCPSSFYFIDAMCAYRHIRNGEAEKPSYALDAILEENLGIRKLKFEEANGLTGIDWHQFMQEKYPLEYVIYNVFDCVSMEELDEKTNDLRLSLPMMSGCSDFKNFKSQPRRLADNLHYYALENNRVIGTTSDQMTDEVDKETLGLDHWITTLPAHLVMDNGLRIIQENEFLSTNIRGHVAD